MASTVSSRQQAMAKARERRSALDQDRVARDRRVEEATAQVLLQLEERAAAEEAVQVANAEIGAALRRLLQDEGIAAEGVGALVDLTLARCAGWHGQCRPPSARGRSTLPGLRRAGRGPAVTWRRCRPWRGVSSNCAGSPAQRWWTPTCTSTTRASTARPRRRQPVHTVPARGLRPRRRRRRAPWASGAARRLRAGATPTGTRRAGQPGRRTGEDVASPASLRRPASSSPAAIQCGLLSARGLA